MNETTQRKDEPPATITADELARHLNISRRTVDRHLAAKRVASIKLGGKRLIPRTELGRLLGAAV